MPVVPGAPARAADIAAIWQVGIELVSFSSATLHTRIVTFPTPFATAPVMPPPNIASGAGPTARWDARAYNITTNQFTMFVYSTDISPVSQNWVNIPVHWTAIVDV